jgi:Protein of unknown function (DUF3079)
MNGDDKDPFAARQPGASLLGLQQVLPGDDLACGNGTIRTPHPCELFGDDWLEWSLGKGTDSAASPTAVQDTG